MTRTAIRLLAQAFSRANAGSFLILFLIWILIQIPYGSLIINAYAPMGWLKQTIFALLLPGLIMPFFYVATYRIILAGRWQPGPGPGSLIRGFRFWPCMFLMVLAMLAGSAVAVLWSALTGGLGWHQFPTFEAEASDLPVRFAEAIGAQTAAAARAVVMTCILIGLPGAVTGRAVPAHAPLLVWKLCLPAAVIIAFSLEALIAVEHVLYNFVQAFQAQWRMAHDALDIQFPPYALSAFQTYVVEFLHAFLLIGATAAIHGAIWPVNAGPEKL